MATDIHLVCLNWANEALQIALTAHLAEQDLIHCDASPATEVLPTVILFKVADDALYALLQDLRGNGNACIIVVAGSTDAIRGDTHWQLLDHGVSDVLVCEPDSLGLLVSQIAARIHRWQEVQTLLQLPLVRDNLIGNSACWQSVLKRVLEVARFTDSAVLVQGESGTGKELFARLIHSLDARQPKRELVILDCSTIVKELSGNDFFGHERGAFTGAMDARDGAFALADGGTLFLDEVGELPLVLQAQLLRVIQEHTYKRVGGNRWKQTNFRLVCATNRDLAEEVKQGRFRADLYYRITMCTFHLPPLRERPEDVLLLATHFLQGLAKDGVAPQMDEVVKGYLLWHSYVGNVRELKQLVTRISHRHVGVGSITVGDIPEEDRPDANMRSAGWRDERFDTVIRRAVALGAGLREISQAASDTAVRVAIDTEAGSLARAADKLGVTLRALQMRRANHRA